MKSSTRALVAACLQALLALIGPVQAEPAGRCEVAVAALNLPAQSTGLLHWRAAEKTTEPLQLSTRYFSERLKVPGSIIQFFEQPIVEETPEPLPNPLFTVTIPPETRLAYVVLRAEAQKNGPARWTSTLLRGEDWKPGCLKVLNACPETVGIVAGKKRLQLPRGKTMDFHARDWDESFPVKIFRLEPETKLVFSSTWRVVAGRRELCFIGGAGRAVTIRSLLDLAMPPAEETP